MIKLKMKWIAIVTLSAAVVAGTAWSQSPGAGPQPEGFDPEIQPEAFDAQGFEPGQGRMGRGGGRGMRMLENPSFQEALGLTEEQTERLRALRFEGAKSAVRSRSELRIKRLELRELMQAEEPDRALIEKKVREISDARYAAQMDRIDRRLAFRAVLTPEQRAKLRTLRSQFRQRRWRRGRGGFGRGQRGFGPRQRGSRRGVETPREGPPQE